MVPLSNIFLAPITDILTVVEPRTTTGCSYSLAKNESKTATLKLKCLLNNNYVHLIINIDVLVMYLKLFGIQKLINLT